MSALGAIGPSPVANPTAVHSEPLYTLTVDQYHEMIRSGILTENDPVELLEGLLVSKMPRSTKHRAAVRKLRIALERELPKEGWCVDTQEAVTLEMSEPEPDVSAVRGATDDYLSRNPNPTDVGLLAEVSADSLRRDRGWKLQIYGRSKIPVYWIINLIDRQIEVYSDPTGPADQPGYRSQQVYRPGDNVPLVVDGKEVARIAVNDLLP